MSYWKFFKANLLGLFVFLASLCVMAFIMYRGDDHAAAKWVYIVCGGISTGSASALFVQWNRRHKGRTDAHPNGHTKPLCENCDRAQYNDGTGPVSFADWALWMKLNNRPVPDDDAAQAVMYSEYVKNF